MIRFIGLIGYLALLVFLALGAYLLIRAAVRGGPKQPPRPSKSDERRDAKRPKGYVGSKRLDIPPDE